MKAEQPTTIIRIGVNPQAPQFDIEARTIRSVILTDVVANDGGVVIPAGVNVAQYLTNPIVRERHTGPVIGRCMEIDVQAREVVALTQFADNERGRDYAYLYGLNPDGEVYMRAWSARAVIIEQDVWGFSRVRQLLGDRFDPSLLPSKQQASRSVWVALKSMLKEYSVVEIGADPNALSRAADDGNQTADELVTRINLTETQRALCELRSEHEQTLQRLDRIEHSMQALSRDGSAAARRGDSAGLLHEVRELRKTLQG